MLATAVCTGFDGPPSSYPRQCSLKDMYSAHPYRWLVIACLVGLLPLLLWQAADWAEEGALRQMSWKNGQRLKSYANGLTQALHDIEVVPNCWAMIVNCAIYCTTPARRNGLARPTNGLKS